MAHTVYYEYEDVFIKPKYSDVSSRADVSTAVTLSSKNSYRKMTLTVPVISSNMDTVTEASMCKAMMAGGGVGALHRFCSISENVAIFEEEQSCFVSIGVNRDFEERADALYTAGARFFIVDIAHGHSRLMYDTLGLLRKKYGRDIFIMAGNVGSPEGAESLATWGADAVKVGIGGGFVCETKNVTGVNTPMFTTVMKCAAATDLPVIADGGARAYGDVAKALGAGATAVMSGYFFAGCPETPDRARVYDALTHTYKPIYRGMASQDAMNVIRGGEKGLPTPEGRSTTINLKPSATVVMEEIAGGLRSAFSYVGAKTFKEFRHKVEFGYRR